MILCEISYTKFRICDIIFYFLYIIFYYDYNLIITRKSKTGVIIKFVKARLNFNEINFKLSFLHHCTSFISIISSRGEQPTVRLLLISMAFQIPKHLPKKGISVSRDPTKRTRFYLRSRVEMISTPKRPRLSAQKYV